MKHIKIKRFVIAGAALALLATPAAVSARDGSDDSSEVSTASTSPSPSPSASPTQSPSRDRKERQFETELRAQLEHASDQRQSTMDDKVSELKQKLDDAKKKVCENHQTTINRLMGLMDKRRQNAFTRITEVSDAVQKFVTDKGLTVTDYDTLVAKVSAAKTVAQSALQAQQAVPNLDCSGEHPRADVSDFKTKRADSIDAMKAYRDAVKALVAALKAVTPSTEPTPSTTPETKS